jgi:hypothetical protein
VHPVPEEFRTSSEPVPNECGTGTEIPPQRKEEGGRREKERKEETADAVSTKYFFESGVIRLSKNDFDKWADAFANLNLKAELLSLTEWAGKQENWFFAVSSALAKRGREVAAQRAKPPVQLTAREKLYREGIV